MKDNIENPFYKEENPEQIDILRDRLECAKLAIVEVGGIYKPNDFGKRGLDFDKYINIISKISLEIGGFFQSYITYIIEFKEDSYHLSLQSDEEEVEWRIVNELGEEASKQEILDSIQTIHIGEWSDEYCTERFGYRGTQWSLEIMYGEGDKAFVSSGSNSYPYNFQELKRLFPIEIDSSFVAVKI